MISDHIQIKLSSLGENCAELLHSLSSLRRKTVGLIQEEHHTWFPLLFSQLGLPSPSVRGAHLWALVSEPPLALPDLSQWPPVALSFHRHTPSISQVSWPLSCFHLSSWFYASSRFPNPCVPPSGSSFLPWGGDAPSVPDHPIIQVPFLVQRNIPSPVLSFNTDAGTPSSSPIFWSVTQFSDAIQNTSPKSTFLNCSGIPSL